MHRGIRLAPAPATASGRATSRRSLIEREEELARIDAALGAAKAGAGATVVIEAEAGIGKTSLLEAAGARAREAAMTVLSARGSQLEGGYAMGVVRQCFEPELRLGLSAASRSACRSTRETTSSSSSAVRPANSSGTTRMPSASASPGVSPMNWLVVERMHLRIAQGRREAALDDWRDSVHRAEPLFGSTPSCGSRRCAPREGCAPRVRNAMPHRP